MPVMMDRPLTLRTLIELCDLFIFLIIINNKASLAANMLFLLACFVDLVSIRVINTR